MTQEEKAKAYDEAIKRAEAVIKVAQNQKEVYGCITTIFPELNQSDDEKIKKEIIQSIQENMCVINKDKCIAWLEKQGEKKTADKKYTFNAIPRLLDMIQPTDRAKAYCQKLIDSLQTEGYSIDAKIVGECLNQMNGEKVAMATMDEQKPADKVEPKFKVGDFIINRHGFIMQIDGIDSNMYVYHVLDNNHLLKHDITKTEESCHLWTIQDAKDGDVLANGNMVLIFKCFEEPSYRQHIIAHIGLDIRGRIQITDKSWNLGLDCAKPATKKQRDLLSQKMKEAGYEWDGEKKELKKIEQKHSEWSEEEIEMINLLISILERNYQHVYFKSTDKGDVNMRAVPAKKIINWLKSLKPQPHWKPSDEQMKAAVGYQQSFEELLESNDVSRAISMLENRGRARLPHHDRRAPRHVVEGERGGTA